MGFLDHSTNNVIVDAVLTDHGRKLIAQTGTQSNIIQGYSFADDEVDYTIVKKYGIAVGKEKIEKNTPIFEASTNEANGVSFFLYTSDTIGDSVRLALSWDYGTVVPVDGAVPKSSGTIKLNIIPTFSTTPESSSINIAYDSNYLTNTDNFTVYQLYSTTDMLSNMKYVSTSIGSSGSTTSVSFKTTTLSSVTDLSSAGDSTTILSVSGASGGITQASLQLIVTI